MTDTWRMVVILMAGIACALCGYALRHVVALARTGSKRVCVPVLTMAVCLFTLIISGLGAATQLVIWIIRHEEFGWHRSPLVFLIVSCQLWTGGLMVGHIFSSRE